MAWWQKLLGKAPRPDPEAVLAAADSKKAAGDYEGAIAEYDKVIETDARSARAFAGRGLARYKKGDLAGALADCGRALELDPDCVAAYETRGLARESSGDVAGAKADYGKSIELQIRAELARQGLPLSPSGDAPPPDL
jgi:tetratricopeptide (TPR) repeat protein